MFLCQNHFEVFYFEDRYFPRVNRPVLLFFLKKCVYPSANRFPATFENEIRNSICVFCFPAISENEIQTSIFVFHFPTTLENGIPNSIFVFRRYRQLNFNFHFCCTSFYCFTKLMFQSVLWSFRSTARINIGTSFLREKAWKTMAIVWCK